MRQTQPFGRPSPPLLEKATAFSAEEDGALAVGTDLSARIAILCAGIGLV